MEKKSPNQGVTDEEIIQIEKDFQQVCGEMCELVSNPMFTDIFRQLHSLIMDSHTKNKKLAEVVQVLNGQIVSNATKVSSLLKMSEDDKLSIERYKDEYNKAWKLITVANSNEAKSAEICENLKTEVNRLSEEVHSQSVNENSINTIKTDINSFLNEIKTAEHEFEVITSDINQMNARLTNTISRRDKAKIEIDEITQTIQLEDTKLTKLKEMQDEYQKEIEKVSTEAKENESDILNNGIQIKNLQKSISENQAETVRYRSILREYQNDADVLYRKIKSWSETKDRVAQLVSKTEGKIKVVHQRIEKTERELESQISKRDKINDIIDKRLIEYDEAQKKSKDIIHEMQLAVRERKNKSQEVIDIMRKLGFKESQIRIKEREIDFSLRQIQKIISKVKNAVLDTKEEKEITEIVDTAISQEKLDQQKMGIKAHDIEWESKVFQQKTHESKIQLVRILDNNGIISTEIENSNRNLEKLEHDSKEQDRFIYNMRHDRDIISNQIKSLEAENQELKLNMNAKNEEILKLKHDIQNRTEECINIHFQTRGVEKQINAMNGVVELTQKLCEQSRATIVGYKAEGAKLRLIYDEAHKDISLAQSEIRNLTDISRLIERQLSLKKTEISKINEDVITVLHQLERRNKSFEQQSIELSQLNEELENRIFQHRILTQKTSIKHELEMDVIALETKLIHEKEIRNRFEEEFERPMNIHRWTILQAMSPHIYKQIMMIQYLKQKLESVKRQQIKLNEKKEKMLKAIQVNNTRMKNCKIQDGKYALNVMKDSLKKKEKELADMEKEMKSNNTYLKEMKETVNTTKLCVKKSHIATSSLKRQMPKTEVPTIPINAPKFIERSRLGGGFSLSSARDKLNTNKVPKTTRPDLIRRKNDEIDDNLSESSSHFNLSNVKTARSPKTNTLKSNNELQYINSQSWKPKKKNANSSLGQKNDLSVKPSISVRPSTELSNGNSRDSLRRKPMKSASKIRNDSSLTVESVDLNGYSNFNSQKPPTSARRTKVTKAHQETSLKTSQSSLSSTSRRQFNVHVTTIDPFC